MGIADQIRKTIQSKLVLKFCSSNDDSNQAASCVLCNEKFVFSGNFSFFISDEGYVCYSCGENFAPDMARALNLISHSQIIKNYSKTESSTDIFSLEEYHLIHENLEILKQVTMDMIKGLSRGIIEAPVGHIGLLHYAKDIIRPVKKEGESEKDYQLRVKTFRMKKIYEKLKAETADRIELLYNFFIRLGMQVSKDRKS